MLCSTFGARRLLTTAYMNTNTNPEDSTMTQLDRTDTARAIAKIIAFKNVGNVKEAQYWTDRLVDQLREAGLLVR